MGGNNTQGSLSDLRESLSKDYWLEWTLTALAVLPALGSLLLCWQLSDGGTWFQRSGSLMVLFAVWLEFRQAKAAIRKIIENATQSILAVAPSFRMDPVQSLFQNIAIGLAILGTIIWGYGDLLFFWQA